MSDGSRVLNPPRPLCKLCNRAQTACICQWIRPLQTRVEVLILQHPMEVRHVKNTGRLLHLSLPNSTLVVADGFDGSALPPKMNILLYPAQNPGVGALVKPPPLPLPLELQLLHPLRLVVLDATWRKSRKMLYQSPWLQQLPRFDLGGEYVSRYTIRKAHQAGQLSTLEATCLAVMQLESDAELLQPLLNSLDGFVAQQQAYQKA